MKAQSVYSCGDYCYGDCIVVVVTVLLLWCLYCCCSECTLVVIIVVTIIVNCMVALQLWRWGSWLPAVGLWWGLVPSATTDWDLPTSLVP